jgi:hypothetical protein
MITNVVGRGLPVALGGFGIAFGFLTIASGGMALFGGAPVGNAVPFVLWFNFLAGFAYIVAGLGLVREAHWGAVLAAGIAGATVAVFAAFLAHVAAGGAYEPRTVGAMVLRSVVWIGIASVAFARERLGRHSAIGVGPHRTS